MASSSSLQPENPKSHLLMDISKSAEPPKPYDVFINHRGPDVKKNLAYDLYDYLQKKGCRVFLDSEQMEMGDNIPSTLKDAICSSSVQIAIFSKRYAESPWCLAELALMLETNARFIPVFYEVKPWELRHVREGKGVYAKAFARHESLERYPENLDKWKTALSNASNFSGYELETNSQYHSMLTKLAVVVEREVRRKKPLDVSKYRVGLDELVADFESQSGVQNGEEMGRVKVIGIFGMGGSGKSTLAKELFNRKRSNYSGSCFVGDVRESSCNSKLASLLTEIMKGLFKEADVPHYQNISEGKSYFRNFMETSGRFANYLIVLDDIDDEDQIDSLLCMDSLGHNSLVIITTRDRSVLMRAGITVHYNLKEMEKSKATELFCWHAFNQPNVVKGYDDLVVRFVRLCQGLPLSLKVLAGLVSTCTDKRKWQQVLVKAEKLLPPKLIKILKISFDALDKEEKQIFLDIACFFIGKPKSTATRIWEGSELSAELAVESLKDKCLVEEGYEVGYSYGDLVLRMHDHLRGMGREIADELSHPRRLWNPKSLKSLESKGLRNILTETDGRCFHSYFDQSICSKVTFFVRESDAGAERSTALLWLELDFTKGQLECISSWIPLRNLQCLRIVNGRLKRLWQEEGSSSSRIPQLILQSLTRIIKTREEGKHQSDAEPEVPVELKELILETTELEEFPYTLEELIYLENLILKGRISESPKYSMLIEGRSFSESLRKLSNLKSLVLWDLFLRGELNLSDGEGADNLGFCLARGMRHLESIHIRGVKLTSKISICGDNCPRIASLRLDSMKNLAEVHLKKVTTLSNLDIRFCEKLKTVSGSFDQGNLHTLSIKECGELEEVPNLSCLTSLRRITIDRCPRLLSINGVEDLDGLQYLYVSTGNGGEGVWNCIQRLKIFPSEISIFIGTAVDRAEITLNSFFFSGLISPDAITELNFTSEIKEREMQESLSAIIICALVAGTNWEIETPYDTVPFTGDRIVTIILTGQKGLDILNLYYGADLKKKYVLTVKGEEEYKGLIIFQKIIAQLYKGIS